MKSKKNYKYKKFSWFLLVYLISFILIIFGFVYGNLNFDYRNKASESTLPYGYIDLFDKTTIAGWAKDGDVSDSPVILHVYVDNMFYDFIAADKMRADVGNHAFHYIHRPFGPGEHKVDIYIIGVNRYGTPDGLNTTLMASGTIASGCSDFSDTDFMQEWCQNNGTYWQYKYKDTTYLTNKNLKIGINNSYGGTIFELYGKDRSTNLIQEHGGSAIQLSLYGYDLSDGKEQGWFSSTHCSSPYSSEQSCREAEGSDCVARFSKGSQISDCNSVKPCNGRDAGFPYNPIQAQATDCRWDSTTNNVYNEKSINNGSGWSLSYNGFANFGKSSAFTGLNLDQTTQLHDTFVEINYALQYNGALRLAVHDQEIPAIFTSSDINYWFYSIDKNDSIQKDHIEAGSEKLIIMSKNMKNRFWGVCDQAETHCLTVYMPTSIIDHLYLKSFADNAGGKRGGAYITPIGKFSFYPGMKQNITVYIIPERFQDAIPIIKSI